MLLCFRCIFHIMCAAVAIFAMNIVHVLQILIKLNRQITCDVQPSARVKFSFT